MKRIPILMLMLVLGFTSCNKYIAPPFTNVSKISQLRKGMKLKQVQDILEIAPYDIYHLQEDNLSIAVFNYRLEKRVLRVPTLNRDEFERQTTNETSQINGELYYDKKYKVLYVLLEDGQLNSFLTSDGYDRSNKLIVSKNTINYVTKNNTHLYDSIYMKSHYFIDLPNANTLDNKRGFFSSFFKNF